jgi:DNA repair exonuclease SbcCD ATPase subunit
MMDDDREENVHFRMLPDEEAEESAIPAQADELRIERLSQRMTLISILIPVLIVVILGVAYLDIKRRVIRTEDTGAETAQHLTEDLESRFSSLSLSQAHLEEAVAKVQDQSNQSLAKAQVNLKKMDETLEKTRKAMASQKDLQAASQKIDQGLANVARSTDEIRAQVDQLSQSLPSRLGQLEQRLTDLDARLTELQKSLTSLENSKIDKAALDLALKLESLKLKRAFDVQIGELQEQIRSQRQTSVNQSRKPPVSSPSPAIPKASQTTAPPGSIDSGKLQEQTIDR